MSNQAQTERRDEDLAVLAAIALMTADEPWTIDNIAAALRRPVDWVRAQIDRTIAEDMPDHRAN